MLDHPAADKAPSARRCARARWAGMARRWVVRVEDMHHLEERIGTPSTATGGCPTAGVQVAPARCPRSAVRPATSVLRPLEHRQPHPSDDAHTDVTIESLEIGGDPGGSKDWLACPPETTSSVIHFTFVAPHGAGLMAVTFSTHRRQGRHPDGMWVGSPEVDAAPTSARTLAATAS